jgi:lariat debranching enzyme
MHGCSSQVPRNVLILQVIFSRHFFSINLKLNSLYLTSRYHQGEQVAPILTIFIGGNHEASNHLQELAYGGWVAPNIFYLGYAGVIQINGIRIGGISGIFKGYNYEKGHHEITPFDNDTVRSVYSIRNLEVFRLSQLTPTKVDILLSHDWPANIWEHGDGSRTGTKEGLLRFKPAFREDMETGRLGSAPCWDLLTKLKPRYWFSAHMHCRFDAIVKHDENEEGGEETKFVALDKCLPRRQFFDFIEIGDEVERRDDGTAILELQYDAEWLAILSLTNKFLNCTRSYTRLPRPPFDPNDKDAPRWNFTPTQEEIENILQKFKNDLKIPQNFKQVVNGYNPEWDGHDFRRLNKPQPMLNPQTVQFCSKLGIDDPLFITASLSGLSISAPSFACEEDKAFKDATVSQSPVKTQLSLPKPINSEEIDLDDLDEEEAKENKVSETKSEEEKKEESPIEEKIVEEKSEAKNEEKFDEIYEEPEPVPLNLVKRPSEETASKVEEPPALSANASALSANASAAKKFKRRNQELRNDDDDDE